MGLFESHPRVYDAVFGSIRSGRGRNSVSTQGRFLESVATEHNPAIRRVLELGAGPGYHALWFAEQGYAVTALDRSRRMVSFCKRRARDAGLDVRVVAGDMRSLSSLGGFDLILVLFDTLRLLRTNHDLVRHARAVRSHLRPGGIYVAAISHPRDQLGAGSSVKQSWSTRYDGRKVSVTWRTRFALMSQQEQIGTCTVRWTERGRRVVHEGQDRFRILLPRELELLFHDTAGPKLVEEYGSYDRRCTVDSKRAWRTIHFYQK